MYVGRAQNSFNSSPTKILLKATYAGYIQKEDIKESKQ